MVSTFVKSLHEGLKGNTPHLLTIFASSSAVQQLSEVVAEVRLQLGDGVAIVGCSADGVAVDGREHEDADGIAFTAAHLPDVAVVPFYVSAAEARSRTASEWRTALDLIPEQQPVFVLFPDPFSVDGQALADGLDSAFPGCPKVGGLASGGRAPGSHRVVCGEQIERAGAVGIAMWGDI
jgi:small ligand-binding sensory domain FIST